MTPEQIDDLKHAIQCLKANALQSIGIAQDAIQQANKAMELINQEKQQARELKFNTQSIGKRGQEAPSSACVCLRPNELPELASMGTAPLNDRWFF